MGMQNSDLLKERAGNLMKFLLRFSLLPHKKSTGCLSAAQSLSDTLSNVVSDLLILEDTTWALSAQKMFLKKLLTGEWDADTCAVILGGGTALDTAVAEWYSGDRKLPKPVKVLSEFAVSKIIESYEDICGFRNADTPRSVRNILDSERTPLYFNHSFCEDTKSFVAALYFLNSRGKEIAYDTPNKMAALSRLYRIDAVDAGTDRILRALFTTDLNCLGEYLLASESGSVLHSIATDRFQFFDGFENGC